jgi:F-type H+-transporting ATPase subunit alpha
VASVIDHVRQHGSFERCVFVVGESDATAGLQFVAPYAATSIGESFMQQGRDVLIVYDELTAHARAYREMALLLRRPPGREAYPGDIFYVHARLLERATCLNREEGKGSLTALPIVETEAQNISAYIPTNLISITDGQVYLSPERFRKGILPAVDVGRSVSRVGGQAQLAAYRKITGPLRLAYAQFEELEKFARFSSQLDASTRKRLNRGQRVRQLLQQKPGELTDPVAQVAAFVAVTRGVFDHYPVSDLRSLESLVTAAVRESLPEICEKVLSGFALSDDDVEHIVTVSGRALPAQGGSETASGDEGVRP